MNNKYFIIESNIGVNLYDIMSRNPGCSDSAATEHERGLAWSKAFNETLRLNRTEANEQFKKSLLVKAGR